MFLEIAYNNAFTLRYTFKQKKITLIFFHRKLDKQKGNTIIMLEVKPGIQSFLYHLQSEPVSLLYLSDLYNRNYAINLICYFIGVCVII